MTSPRAPMRSKPVVADDSDDDHTIPPPPPPSTSGRDTPTGIGSAESTGQWAAMTAAKARRESKKAIELAQDANDGIAETKEVVNEIKSAIGQSPDAARGTQGSGLMGVVHGVVKRFDDDLEERNKRRMQWGYIIKGIIAGAAFISTILGIASRFGWLK